MTVVRNFYQRRAYAARRELVTVDEADTFIFVGVLTAQEAT